jgi:hypothetical protein
MNVGGPAPGDGVERVTKDTERSHETPDIKATQPTEGLSVASQSQDTSPDISRNTSYASMDQAVAIDPIISDGAASQTLGRSASLRTPGTSIRHADDSKLYQQTSLPFSISKKPSSQLRPSSRSSQSISVHTIERTPTTHHAGRSESHLQTFETRSAASESEAYLPSAASSPGLFTPISSPLRPDFERSDFSELHSSPFLHYTHRQAPKE